MRGPMDFVAGVELQSGYRPNWFYYNPQTVQSVQALGANWLHFHPELDVRQRLAAGIRPRS